LTPTLSGLENHNEPVVKWRESFDIVVIIIQRLLETSIGLATATTDTERRERVFFIVYCAGILSCSQRRRSTDRDVVHGIL